MDTHFPFGQFRANGGLWGRFEDGDESGQERHDGLLRYDENEAQFRLQIPDAQPMHCACTQRTPIDASAKPVNASFEQVTMASSQVGNRRLALCHKS